MVVSDAYHVAGHSEEEHVTQESSHQEYLISVSDGTIRHFSCDYWSLFATFSATAPTLARVVPISVPEVNIGEFQTPAPKSNKPLTCRLRGPPHLHSA